MFGGARTVVGNGHRHDRAVSGRSCGGHQAVGATAGVDHLEALESQRIRSSFRICPASGRRQRRQIDDVGLERHQARGDRLEFGRAAIVEIAGNDLVAGFLPHLSRISLEFAAGGVAGIDHDQLLGCGNVAERYLMIPGVISLGVGRVLKVRGNLGPLTLGPEATLKRSTPAPSVRDCVASTGAVPAAYMNLTPSRLISVCATLVPSAAVYLLS